MILGLATVSPASATEVINGGIVCLTVTSHTNKNPNFMGENLDSFYVAFWFDNENVKYYAPSEQTLELNLPNWMLSPSEEYGFLIERKTLKMYHTLETKRFLVANCAPIKGVLGIIPSKAQFDKILPQLKREFLNRYRDAWDRSGIFFFIPPSLPKWGEIPVLLKYSATQNEIRIADKTNFQN